jgi:hypothetical protein
VNDFTPPEGDFVHRVESVLLDRMDRIERENRRLRRFGNMMIVAVAIVVGLAAAVFWYTGRFGIAGAVPQNIVARQFTLRNADGTTRGTWGVADDGTVRLLLNDAKGRARVRMSLLADGSAGLSFADTADHKLIVMGSLPDQTSSFVMSSGAGVPRAVLGISGAGAANLVFADQGGATKTSLGVDAKGKGAFTVAEQPGAQIEEPAPDVDTTGDPTDDGQAQAPADAPPAPRKAARK